MPKVPSFKSLYIPADVYFLDASGKLKRNADFLPLEQVKVELTYADIEQKNAYMQFVYRSKANEMETRQDYAYNTALRKHVKSITNLEDENGIAITDGAHLVNCQNPGLNDLKQDLFQRICGIRIDADEDDGPGEFTLGEEKASS